MRSLVLHPKTTGRLVLASVLLVGCAVTSYQAPVAGLTAKLVVRNDSSGGNSTLFTYGDLRSCGSLQRVVDGTPTMPEDFSVNVKAGAPIGFHYGSMVGGRYCAVTFQFTPATNGTYLLDLHSSAEGCAAGVYVVRNGQPIPESSRMRLVPNSTGASCSPAAAGSNTETEIRGVDGKGQSSRSGVTLDDLKGLK